MFTAKSTAAAAATAAIDRATDERGGGETISNGTASAAAAPSTTADGGGIDADALWTTANGRTSSESVPTAVLALCQWTGSRPPSLVDAGISVVNGRSEGVLWRKDAERAMAARIGRRR